MIISHKHKFIYIKNRKVGSTSAEKALQAICGPDDVLTPDHIHKSEHDVLLPLARNWDGRFNPLRELSGARTPIDAARIIRDFAKRPKFYNHMRASSVRARIPRDIWDSYYKFCVERNPWDKTVSFYYWFSRGNPVTDIDSFYQNYTQYGSKDQVFPSDWTRYTAGNRVIVDDVFDFADMTGGIITGLQRAGVPDAVIDQVEMTREKANVRKKDAVQFAPETDALIRKIFKREIATFPFCREPL